MPKISSPSRTYVAICNTSRFDGHYLRQFILPETHESLQPEHNDTEVAAWFFMNHIDPVACVGKVITREAMDTLKVVQ